MRSLLFGLLLLCVPLSYAHQIETDNVCLIFKHHPAWQVATKATEKKWGVSQAIQMAIMNTESKFKGTAKNHHSSARGYAQVINRTWRAYEKDVGKHEIRSHFADASNFIGWYASQMHDIKHIPLSNALDIYLAYHEGLGGYTHALKHKHSMVYRLAKHVQARASRYQKKLNGCLNILDE